MTAPWPIRPTPNPGEPLSAYIIRLATANGMHWRRVVPELRDVTLSPGDLDRVSAVSGLTPTALRDLTLDRYPPSVRGQGPTLRAGWKLHPDTTWHCPHCEPMTGRTQLLWQTALLPICTHCHTYLRRGMRGIPATRATPATRVTPEAIDITTRLVSLTEDTTTELRACRHIASFRRLCASIAQTIDPTWPPRPDGHPVVDPLADTGWGAYPCPDPATVATILVAAAPALDSTLDPCLSALG